MKPLASCLYRGWIRHRRHRPTAHAFRYHLFMLYLDLDELPQLARQLPGLALERWQIASFRRRDYLGDPQQPLREAVLDRVAQVLGRRPSGPVRMLTHLRYWGVSMNPVTFYYCFAPDGEQVEAIVAETTNTPWRERHAYVIDPQVARRPGGSTVLRQRFAKQMHVSPFNPLEMEYEWRGNVPGERLALHMINWQAGAPVTDATLALQAEPLTASGFRRVLWQFPWMTVKVLLGIYYEALRLWLKRVPLHPHPRRRARSEP